METSEGQLLVKMLDGLGLELRADIAEVKVLSQTTLAEARKTNGRVTVLERRLDVKDARAEGRAEVVAEDLVRSDDRRESFRWSVGTLLGFAGLVSAVTMGLYQLFS